MTAEAIRYYLHNLDDLRRDIADLDADIAQYKAMLPEHVQVCKDEWPYRATGSKDFKIQLTNNTSPTERLALKRADYTCTLEKTLRHMKDILESIEWVIRHFTASEREVYRMKYVEKKERRYVAKKIGWWPESISRIDGRIIRDIQKHYENMQKK